jgi:hypothetical protein
MILAPEQGGSLCGSWSKIVVTPVNGRPSLFDIDSVHHWRLLISALCWSINTKSIVTTVKEENRAL